VGNVGDGRVSHRGGPYGEADAWDVRREETPIVRSTVKTCPWRMPVMQNYVVIEPCAAAGSTRRYLPHFGCCSRVLSRALRIIHADATTGFSGASAATKELSGEDKGPTAVIYAVADGSA